MIQFRPIINTLDHSGMAELFTVPETPIKAKGGLQNNHSAHIAR
jgi:hypothetical protein